MQKEINKFLKKISAEKQRQNHKECIELYNIVGGLYTEVNSYHEAIHYHEQALELCKQIGNTLGTAVAYRYIGEAKAALEDFPEALKNVRKYLELAKKLSNADQRHVEAQRAHTTLGRIYLMQAQVMKEQTNVVNDAIKKEAREAEKQFQEALRLANDASERKLIVAKEYAQMKSGLLINLGLIKDICGQTGEAMKKLLEAIDICKEGKLKEDLYRGQIILTGILRQRLKGSNIKAASQMSEAALQTAKSIGKKIHICEALIELGLVRICQRNFKNAKRTFAQAYLEKSPSEEDHAKAIRLTKLAHLISDSYDKISKDDTPSDTKLQLCDKLGDLFVAIDNYRLAIDYYKKALDTARVCAKPKNELARILYSLAETYSDDGQFDSALKCYRKELSLRNGNNKEQCQTLIKIAHMHEYLEQSSEEVCEAYEKAFEKAEKEPKLIYNVLKYYVPYLEKKSIKLTRLNELKAIREKLKSYPEVVEEIENENYEEVNELEDEITNVDDIITDDEDDDEVLMIGKRKSKGSAKFKPNEVGDTPLHEACIKGDFKRVKWLIDQGHDVNPRDNAGWIPLHEACNHGHFDIAEFLIEHGADVNNRGLKGVSPLHDAATNGHFGIMRLLMTNGANAIALTDTGETVLSCLRDYKKRNYSNISKEALSEYNYMEMELLNVMDKCGFDLMSENMKNLGAKGAVKDSERALTEEAETAPRPKIRNPSASLDIPESNPVKDYRNVIGTLQRRRLKEDETRPNDSVKPSQPAIYHSSMSTSASTKEWLIDDVSRQNKIERRRTNFRDIFDEVDKFSSDEEVEEIPQNCNTVGKSNSNKRTSSDMRSHEKSNPPKRILLESDDEELFNQRSKTPSPVMKISDQDDEDVLFIGQHSSDMPELNLRSPGHIDETSHTSARLQQTSNEMDRSGRASSVTVENCNSDRSAMPVSKGSFDLFTQPLAVSIDNRKLLIPIKDESLTVEQLKKMIIDRYSCLVDTEPVISLSPQDDPDCILFDDDLCKDVIRCNLVASIESWKLQKIEQSYLRNCSKANLEPLNFIKIEMRGLDESEDVLDLSYMRFPRAHAKPIVVALARRRFISANLTGLASLFEQQALARDLLSTIVTWDRLKRLNLRCCGLMRSHLESIAGSDRRLPELVSLDLSFNSIAYKSKAEFVNQIQRLRQMCPRLQNLDMRRNHLQFVKPLMCDLDASVKADESLNLWALLNMVPQELEILGANQYDYSIYNLQALSIQ